jgi:hypothetical protein
MTTTPTPNPMEAVYKSILSAYTPLDIKDILLHGAARKAVHHKTEDDILTFYANHNEGLHHELLDAKEKYFRDYAIMQYCYNQSDKTAEDQFHYLRDVVWLYIEKAIENEVLAIELDLRKKQLHVIDGGKE